MSGLLDPVRQRLTAQLIYGLVFLMPFGLLMVAVLISSYGWRMEHDTPHLHYAAFMSQEFGRLPYRDIYELNFPGALGFHAIIVGLFGPGDLAFRCVDIASVLLLAALTTRLLWPWGKLAAVSAAVIFPAIYLGNGQVLSLQRDYLGVILVAVSLNAVTLRCGRDKRMGGIGLIFSCAGLIKPHLLIGAPAVFWLALRLEKPHASIGRGLIAAATGALIPIAVVCFWLGFDGLASLWDIVCYYLPLYSEINGDFRILEDSAALQYRLSKLFVNNPFGWWFIAATAGYALLARQSNQARIWAIGFAVLCIAYGVSVFIAGKYWAYHQLPFAYFCVVGSCLLLSNMPDKKWHWHTLCAPLVVVALVFSTINHLQVYPRLIARQLASDTSIFSPKGGRVDEIANHLRQRAQPGDFGQALDTTGGAVHAMLEVEMPLATSFIYDYHFYHHTTEPYIQQLRRRFIQELEAKAPRFVIEITARNKPFVKGLHTTREFSELRRLLNQHYAVYVQEKDYRIYERRAEIAE